MTDNNFIFKISNKDKWADINYRLIARITACRVHSKEDFQVEIKPYSKRSLNALNTYWMLINTIVKWDSGNNDLKADVWDEWFKKEARLVEEFDNMPLWILKFKKDKPDWTISYKNYDLREEVTIRSPNRKEKIILGSRYVEKTRSIANKGDVTKLEMERLISKVLDFGAVDNNNVPGCFIEDVELERLLKSYK